MKNEYQNQFPEIETENNYIDEPLIEKFQIDNIMKTLTIIAILLSVIAIGIFILVYFIIEFKSVIYEITKEIANLKI